VAVLQDLIDDSLALIAARKVMYADAKGEGRTIEVADVAGEKAAIANGFSPRTTAISESYPKTMDHPGYPNGGATGMMVKDYRGKDANQEIWKYDSGLAGRIAEHLKQVAIEEGQWADKRDVTSHVSVDVAKVELRIERHRIADAKKEALAKGLPWPPPQ
jgi:hypothetical protein